MLPQHQQDTCERQDLLIEPNSCFSDLSDFLSSLNSMKALLHSGKNPLSDFRIRIVGVMRVGVCLIPFFLTSSNDK